MFDNFFAKLTHQNQLTINSHLYSETPTSIKDPKAATCKFDYPIINLLNLQQAALPKNQLLFSIIWLVGLLCFFIYTSLVYLKFSIKLNRAKTPTTHKTDLLLAECKKITGINRNILLCSFSEIKIPCLWGFFKPKILLSHEISTKLSAEQQKYILLHELSHYQRKDHLITLIIILLKSCYWFNPLIWYAFYCMQQDCEIACDNYALSYLTSKERPNYAKTILKLLSFIKHSKPTLATLSLISQRRGIETRLKMILDLQKPNFKCTILGLIIIASLSWIGFTNACGISETLSFNHNKNQPLSTWPIPGHTEILKTYNLEPITLSQYTLEKIDAIKECPSLNDIESLEKELKRIKLGINPGIDIKAPCGSKIVAVADGIVLDVGYQNDFGCYVILQHSENFTTFYAYCQKILVKKGEKIHVKEIIATSGNTGIISSTSLHFELRQNGMPMNPFEYMEYNL